MLVLSATSLRAQEKPPSELSNPEKSAAETSDYNKCILFGTLSAPPTKTASDIRDDCQTLTAVDAPAIDWENFKWTDLVSINKPTVPGAITKREELEKVSKNSSFVMTPYRPNYLLPFAYSNNANVVPFEGPGISSGQLDHLEAQFQISFKFPVLDDFLIQDSSIWVGYTLRAFWQTYNAELSRPFRETNHEPEIFWNFPSSVSILGMRNVSNDLVWNHQSNGQSGGRTRSWNRVMLASYWEKGDLGIIVKPWYRLPEGIILEDPNENPDIEDYLGNFELLTNYQISGHSFSLMLRNNLSSDNKGAAELSYSFPWLSKVDGTIKYFNGYGESMVDYNLRVERLSFGIQITDWF